MHVDPGNRPDFHARRGHRFQSWSRDRAVARGILIVLLWLLSSCASPNLYPATLIAAECPLPVPEELEEGRTITCGYLQVPQDRSAPGGRQIRLPYARIRAESAHPLPDPLVYIVGGPGGSALAEFTQVYAWFRPLRRDRDLIIYDQRGTLLADPVLECGSHQPPSTATGAETEMTIDALSTRVPQLLRPLDANDVAVARCAVHLQAQGIDLAHYDTLTHARDLLDLLAALGYQQYNLYGTSYGTRIALEVMRLAPAGLRAVVLDSVFPPTVNAYEMPHAVAAQEALRHLFAACAQDGACNTAYPDLAARFEAARVQRNRDPLRLPLSWQPAFRGDDLLQLLVTRLDHRIAPYVPRLVDEVSRDDSTTLVALLRGELPPPALPRAAPVAAADEARVSEFVLALNGALMAHTQHDADALREWQQLTARNADRERLSRFLEEYLPPIVAHTLLEQLARLTGDDLALAFAELRSVPLHPLTIGANLAVECRDEQPFNDYAAAVHAHQQANLPAPLLADELSRLRHIWAQCALFPTGTAAAMQNQPVTSRVPVLILQGMLDTITPPSWAAVARRTLPNAYLFEFPNQGHLVIQSTATASAECPTQMTQQFLDSPTQAPDAACIAADHSIQWVLPEE